MAKKKLTLAQRVTRNPSLLAKYQANPGLRSKLPDRFLTGQQRAQRHLNARLNAPLVAGSSTPYRDAARQASAAADVRYGDALRQGQQQVSQAQQSERDTAGWYDQYLAELAKHQENIANIGRQQVAGQQALAGSLPSTQTAGMSGENQQVAALAAAVRQGIAGTYGQTAVDQAAARNAYADTLAHDAGPTAKLAALMQARGRTGEAQSAVTGLLKEKGSYRQQVIDQARQDESKNVMAAKALGLDQSKALASATAEAARIAETGRHNRASERNTRAQTQAAQGKVNQYGYTDKDWRALTTQERQRVIRDFKAGKGRAGKPATAEQRFQKKYGVKPASQEKVQNAQGQIDQAKQWYRTVKQSNPKLKPNEIMDVLVQGQKGKGDEASIPATQALWVRVAYEVMHGGITPGTANRLHHAGYSVKALGLPVRRVAGAPVQSKTPRGGKSQGGGRMR